jgi:REP element-mobilizing transposase RayT
MEHKDGKTAKGWYTRGRLPHFDGGQIWQFITIRLYDSLPQNVLTQFKAELAARDVENIARETLILIDKYLDQGVGSCYLQRPEIAELIENALLFHHGTRYELRAWVVMPNHVHFLVRPLEGYELHKIIHSIKSFTSHEANKMLGRSGTFWMREYFDRYIRDSEHFAKTVRYIHRNPVAAKLCDTAEDWRFGSARLMGGSLE